MSDEASNPQVPTPGPKAPSPVISNADLLAEMDSMGDDLDVKAEAKDKPNGKPGGGDSRSEQADSDDAEADASADSDGEGDETSGDDGEESEAEEVEEGADAEADESEEKPDPLAAKRIADIQKAEKRSKEQIDAYRAQAERDFDDRRRAFEAEWKPKVESHAKLNKLVERLDVDPVAYANERGWDDERKLYFAEQMYLEVNGQKDPKLREKAIERRRLRETDSKATALEKQLQETNAKFERLEQERRDEKYIAKASTAVTDKTPILRAMLEKKPEIAHARILAATKYLREHEGAEPDPADVIKRLEEAERQDLIVRGIDPDKVYGAKPKTKPEEGTPKTKANEAGERKTAMKTNGKKPTTPPPQKPPPTRDQLLKELEELDRN